MHKRTPRRKVGPLFSALGKSLGRYSYSTQIDSPFDIIPFQTSLILVAGAAERLFPASQWLPWVPTCFAGCSTVIHSNMQHFSHGGIQFRRPAVRTNISVRSRSYTHYQATGKMTQNYNFVTRKEIPRPIKLRRCSVWTFCLYKI